MNVLAASEYTYEFAAVAVFVLAAVAFVFGSLFVSWMVRPHRPTQEMLETYECGEDPVGIAWFRLNLRFYVLALLFVLFDVELVLVFPVAMLYRGAPAGVVRSAVFLELAAFVGILFLGLVYAWRKGDLEWVRRIPEMTARAREAESSKLKGDRAGAGF